MSTHYQRAHTISALIQPDVNINIEVSTGAQMQRLAVSNATTIMALKVQICGVMRCGVAPEKLELKLGDAILEDDAMPLHFYGVSNGTKLDVIKPYINVSIEDNHGLEIYWRLNRKSSIREVKQSLPLSTTHAMANGRFQDGYHGKVDGMRLYDVKKDLTLEELFDDDIVDNRKIKEEDKLFLLAYRWSHKCIVTVTKTGRRLGGAELSDTCRGIKVKVQDQTGLPAGNLHVFKSINNHTCTVRDYFYQGKPITGLQDHEKPFLKNTEAEGNEEGVALVVISDDEIQGEAPRVEAEWRAEMERRREETRRQNEETGLTIMHQYKHLLKN